MSCTKTIPFTSDFALFECDNHRLIVNVHVVALRAICSQRVKGLMDQPQVYISHAVNFQRLLFLPPVLSTTSHLCHAEINYFMSPNMQIILLNERCLTSQIQLICKCK